MATKMDMKLDMTNVKKKSNLINGLIITFYVPSVLGADASTMTTESTEIKISTAHAETMTETKTTYDMMMTTEIEPEHLSAPRTTSYSKLDIESATHILTRSTPNIVLDATNNILPSMPNYVNYCNLSTMPSAPTADAPLPSLSTVNNVFSSSPNYQRKTDNSMFTYFSRKKAATSTFSLEELLRPPPGPDICERLLAIAAIFGLSLYKCQDPDTFRGLDEEEEIISLKHSFRQQFRAVTSRFELAGARRGDNLHRSLHHKLFNSTQLHHHRTPSHRPSELRTTARMLKIAGACQRKFSSRSIFAFYAVTEPEPASVGLPPADHAT